MLGPLLLLCACAVASPATAVPADALIGRLSQALQEEINSLDKRFKKTEAEHSYISHLKGDLDKRIINGDDAEKHEHPYIASLQWDTVGLCLVNNERMENIAKKCYDLTSWMPWSKKDDCVKEWKKFKWYATSCLVDGFNELFYWNSEKDSLCNSSKTRKKYLETLNMCLKDSSNELCSEKNSEIQDIERLCLVPPKLKPKFLTSGDDKDWIHNCGGTLIKDDVVLTAAHCLETFNEPEELEQQRVVLGEHHLEEVDENETHRKISGIKIFPSYDTETIENDIALIFLSQKVDLSNPTLQVAKLSDNDDAYENKDCLITGWGLDDSEREVEILQELLIKNIPLKECQAGGILYQVKSTNICVYNEQNSTNEDHTGACNGDSGGPMMCGKNLDRLSGVASFVYRDCKDLPSIYTRVSSYKTWIDMWTSDDYLDLLWISDWDKECKMKMEDFKSGQPNPCPPPSLSDLRMLIGNHETDSN